MDCISVFGTVPGMVQLTEIIPTLQNYLLWYHGTMVLYTQKVNLRGVASYTSH